MPAYTSDIAFADDLLLMLGRGVIDDLAVAVYDLDIVVRSTLLSYGAASAAEATDVARLWAFGKWRLWEWAAAEYAAQFRVATDNQTLDRQQKWDHAKAMRDAAKADLTVIVDLELTNAEADGSFDFAEMVLDPFGAREQLHNEALRSGY